MDLVSRLRATGIPICLEAASEIERLQREGYAFTHITAALTADVDGYHEALVSIIYLSPKRTLDEAKQLATQALEDAKNRELKR